MNIIEINKGLKQGKKYKLPNWERICIFAIDDGIYIKFGEQKEKIYNLHVSEIESDEWIEA